MYYHPYPVYPSLVGEEWERAGHSLLPRQQISPVPQAQIPQAPFPFVPGQVMPPMMPLEMSFIENILRLNRGKMARFYFTYENNPDWPSMIYEGRIEEAGRDHIIISNPETGKSYLLLMVNLDYVEFDEPVEYIPMFPSPPVLQRPLPQHAGT